LQEADSSGRIGDIPYRGDQGFKMTTFEKGVGPVRAGVAIRRPFKALAAAALLLGTTAIFEPGPARAQDLGGLIGMMRHYGGFSSHSRSSRHQSRHESRRESRHASRHRQGHSREAQQNESAPASEEPATKSASSSTPPPAPPKGDAPNFTPAR
jgi:hypothetical protein